MAKKKKKKNKAKPILILLVGIGILFGGFYVFDLYKKVYAPNVKEHDGYDYYFHIPTNATFENVVHKLLRKRIIEDEKSFRWVAQKMNYPNQVKAGRYYIEPRMNNRELISLLRSGEQKPIQLVLRKYRTKQDLVTHVSNTLEVDSTVLLDLLNDKVFLRQYGVNPDNVMRIFISNTYEFFWNTNATNFFERMIKEYKHFWNKNRQEKASQKGFTPAQIMIIASIVEEETNQSKEKSKIAGVYVNRLHKNMRLQADPTVRFALQDFGLTRILKDHTQFTSPYNTYRVNGLPPGPICTPSRETIDATLNAEKHQYLYFCADPKFSGYHLFASSYTQHLRNARNYHRELNRRKIR